MLLINPHTSFFFREEAQMVSEEGLNAYGALTWGQFFIYQGFNDKAGWMHTSSSVDNIDEYLETVTKQADGSYTYRVGTEERPLIAKKIVVPFKSASGMAQTRVHHLPHASRPDRPAGRRQVGEHAADAGAAEGADAVVLAHQGAQPRRVQEGDGGAHQLVEQHALRRRRRQHRLLPLELHPEARPEVRLDQAGGRHAIRRPSGTACCRSTNRRTSSIHRTAGSTTPTTIRSRRRARNSPKQKDFPGLRGFGQREPARRARDPRARRQEGLHARLADRRGLRQLPAGVRDPDSAAAQGARGRRRRRIR